MDKFMESKWFMRILALLLALLLFTSVHDNKSLFKDIKSNKSHTSLQMPVVLYYDEENMVVTGIPKSVEVTLSGPSSLVEYTKSTKNFSVYVDLSNAKIGRQRVKIKVKDLTDKLKAKISPAEIEVSVQEKVTVEKPVAAEFSSDLLAEGFEAGEPSVNPKTVKITGARDVIDQISYVRAVMNLNKKVDTDLTRDASVQVLDRNLNKLNVTVEPYTVEVTVPVKNPSKTVPITINPTGKEKNGVVIDSISTEPKNVTIYGRSDVLKSIDELTLDVDISKIDKDTDLTIPLKSPKGVNKLDPATVTVKVKVQDKVEQKTFSNMKISSKGLDDKYDLEFLSPLGGNVDLKVSGTSQELKSITNHNFDVFLDLAGLKPGDHEVSIEVNGPNDVSWELSSNKAKIRLTEKNQSNV
ncbi:CdaR family protein [Bacillus sp. FJAT-49736]|uniref:CdaR family protein n=1 Tax=Bacillus sp. FJAT-49736 TaxID=2833582 RepID=UPI001BCA44AF|nr:CdaR family protein [Bacillus sp. FJAT-49736]MBS4174785.1 YbbR-like domain-containing protein [Bacillus sp. FJAT-49736]